MSNMIKKGDLVKVNKGATITFQKTKTKTASRAQNVKIHAFRNGRSVSIKSALFDSVLQLKLIALGYSLESLESKVKENAEASIEIEPAAIVWLGNGGYFHETSINNISKA